MANKELSMHSLMELSGSTVVTLGEWAHPALFRGYSQFCPGVGGSLPARSPPPIQGSLRDKMNRAEEREPRTGHSEGSPRALRCCPRTVQRKQTRGRKGACQPQHTTRHCHLLSHPPQRWALVLGVQPGWAELQGSKLLSSCAMQEEGKLAN